MDDQPLVGALNPIPIKYNNNMNSLSLFYKQKRILGKHSLNKNTIKRRFLRRGPGDHHLYHQLNDHLNEMNIVQQEYEF